MALNQIISTTTLIIHNIMICVLCRAAGEHAIDAMHLARLFHMRFVWM